MITVYRSETSASLRRIPLWLVGSDGTTPGSAAGGQPQINWLARGTATVNTSGTLSLVSANAGEHYIELTASEVSALGIGAVHYRGAAILPASTYFQIANFDSGNSINLGLTAFSEVTLHAGTHSDVTIKGIQNFANISNVTLHAGTHSDVTIKGIQNYANISSVTLMATEYSNVTVRISPQAYSGLTVGVNNIVAGNWSGVTVEVSNIGRSSMQSIADSFLRRGIAMGTDVGRNVQDAFRLLRNRVAISGSRMTVYSEDDSSSAWTASVTTSTNASPIDSVDPGGV